MDIISRKDWGARAARSVQTVSWRDRTEVVVHYSEGPPTQSVRSIQDFHMDGRGWSDIGYNFLVDVQGRIYEGRGWLTVGAHAPGHNASGIGVCMIGRDGDATSAATRSIRALYDEAGRRAGRSLAKLGHRDVYATSCPGDELWSWVHAGMPVDEQSEEDDMPDYVSVSTKKAVELPPNMWVTVNFDTEHADKAHHHWDKGGPSLVIGSALYQLNADLRIEGLPLGVELQVRTIEHRDSDGYVEANPAAEFVSSAGSTLLHYQHAADHVKAGSRVRLQVVQFGKDLAHLTFASAKAFAWPK